jgi:hypothetical protein
VGHDHERRLDRYRRRRIWRKRALWHASVQRGDSSLQAGLECNVRQAYRAH